MKIYIGHSTSYDFREELYAPIQNSALVTEHEVVLPHLDSDEQFSSKEFFANGCDLFVAEVSHASTGLGIEIGWADTAGVPMLFVHAAGTKPSGALTAVEGDVLEYASAEELITIIENKINS